MSDEKIRVLVFEPLKDGYVREIHGLKEMQALVGGYIQEIYPFAGDNVCLICNDEGKLLGLPYNRPLFDRQGRIFDIVCGNFFLAGFRDEDHISLTDEQIFRYKGLFDNVAVITTETSKEQKRNQSTKKTRER